MNINHFVSALRRFFRVKKRRRKQLWVVSDSDGESTYFYIKQGKLYHEDSWGWHLIKWFQAIEMEARS